MNNKICLILILLNFWINQNKNRIHSFYLIMRQNILFSFGVRQIMILWEYSPGSDRMTCTTKKGRSPKAAPFLKTIITIQPRGCLKKIKISVFFCKQRRMLCQKASESKRIPELLRCLLLLLAKILVILLFSNKLQRIIGRLVICVRRPIGIRSGRSRPLPCVPGKSVPRVLPPALHFFPTGLQKHRNDFGCPGCRSGFQYRARRTAWS